MISLQRLRDDPEAIRDGARKKGEEAPVAEILELDRRARELRSEMESLRSEQKKGSKVVAGGSPDREAMKALKDRIQTLEGEVGRVEGELKTLLLYVPNPPHESVPVGVDETGNVCVRTEGAKPSFSFPPKAHYDFGMDLGLFDFTRAAKLSGARFAVLRGWGPRLQRALIAYMADVAKGNGYEELSVPYLVRRDMMVGTANLPKFEDDAFHSDDDLFLIPTAEVPVTNFYRDEILSETDLPLAHFAHTPCFRREAGSAGKDTRGFIRLHQFDKVELVRFVHPATSLEELELLTSHAEAVLKGLGLHYRVLSMCTGDMGFAQWKKYDLEAWAPGMNAYLEVSSCSTFADFQARRAGLRYRDAKTGKVEYLHTLNGSALAVPRTLVAILENYQQEDGSVSIPPVLQPYLGITRLDAAGAAS